MHTLALRVSHLRVGRCIILNTLTGAHNQLPSLKVPEGIIGRMSVTPNRAKLVKQPIDMGLHKEAQADQLQIVQGVR
jgi:hypothetical protein